MRFPRQPGHTPGERLFIDYGGQTVGVTDGSTGEIREAQVFVAVLGASNYTYLEATWSQQLPDWIGSQRGFSEAIKAVFPEAQSPTCVVHLILNSMRQASWTIRSSFTSPTLE